MKFGYSYKTPDGTRHESIFHADAKEDVFATLRGKGIRPIKVWKIDSPSPARERHAHGILIPTLVAALTVAITLAVSNMRHFVPNVPNVRTPVPGVPQVEDRSQIYGDPGLLQTCEAQGWSNVFEDEGVRFLARFAQPGRKVRIAAGNAWRKTVADALRANRNLIRVAATDGEEVAKMKRIVNGMKRELAQYIADGGTVEKYIDEVLARQSVEEKIVINFMTEFEKLRNSATKENRDDVIAKWNEKNVLLRQMGLRTVLIPEKIESLDE